MFSENNDKEIGKIRKHTSSYMKDPEFQREWGGLSWKGMAVTTQQQRAFNCLTGSIWTSLERKKILDVGCGNGRILRWMLELGASPENLLGIDISDGEFENAFRLNPSIKLLKVNGLNIPVDDGIMDLVMQFTCFMCIDSDEVRKQVAGEMIRVLRPGGYIFWWDLPTTFIPGKNRKENLPKDLFGYLPVREFRLSLFPLPSETIRPLRGLGPIIGRILDSLGYRPTHIAALIGPK